MAKTSATDASIDWEAAIPWLRSITKLQIWLKGVTSPEDVALAIRHGLDGVIVSNHGGRQLDGQPATLDALRDCAPVAAGKIPIALDGGIRRGSDIFKAIAMGATAVFGGRIPIWGLAVGFVRVESTLVDVELTWIAVQRTSRGGTSTQDPGSGVQAHNGTGRLSQCQGHYKEQHLLPKFRRNAGEVVKRCIWTFCKWKRYHFEPGGRKSSAPCGIETARSSRGFLGLWSV